MRRIVAAFAAAAFALALAVGITPAASAATSGDTLGCTYTKAGNWLDGEGMSVRCTGSRFTGKNYGKYSYQVYVICDRIGWQANVVRYGSWEFGGGRSTKLCGAVGDWGMLGYGMRWRKN